MKNSAFKKILALVLAGMLVFGAAPAAFAAEEETAPEQGQSTSEQAEKIANDILDLILDLIDRGEEEPEEGEDTPAVNPDDTGSVDDIRDNLIARGAVGDIVKAFAKAVVETLVRYARYIISVLGQIEWEA